MGMWSLFHLARDAVSKASIPCAPAFTLGIRFSARLAPPLPLPPLPCSRHGATCCPPTSRPRRQAHSLVRSSARTAPSPRTRFSQGLPRLPPVSFRPSQEAAPCPPPPPRPCAVLYPFLFSSPPSLDLRPGRQGLHPFVASLSRRDSAWDIVGAQ